MQQRGNCWLIMSSDFWPHNGVGARVSIGVIVRVLVVVAVEGTGKVAPICAAASSGVAV